MSASPRHPFGAPARRIAAWALVVAVVAGTIVVPAGTAWAQEGSEPPVPTTLRELPGDAGRIVKHPNYGHEPTHAGDRGGWQQALVLVLVLGGLAGMGALAWREVGRRRPPPEPGA